MKTRFLAIGLFLCGSLLSGLAQQKLADMVSEARAEWMLGKWDYKTDSGSTITLSISWDLDKTLVVFHGKGDDMEFKGFSALDPSSGEVKYVSFDSRGIMGKGTWGMESEELVLRVESVSAERSWKMGVVFGGSASEGLVVRMHQVGDSGGLVSPARTTLKFKKQK